jgi:hypothetical protein
MLWQLLLTSAEYSAIQTPGSESGGNGFVPPIGSSVTLGAGVRADVQTKTLIAANVNVTRDNMVKRGK